ncbi:hypothetical protein DICPUDRAFT_85031 [Dictyostelium purpureum]|uniref:RRM domain-containing protein n=1 Tax=Dictyostelium purpureum TaxID=5786 RepID=F1A4H1_DICPU|nr:uncharacterized protein DICPUDRAFT_85031 [Dictyostelium purpureum]EGC28909.1 hypothetical protein DICPUDRAFT_85031 [Dictyostelium purpureum]|eukprot:XP_003294564.1 hypothetical protein DICPUDRAFT_85031 [Dictyostelium purpureum]
MVSRASQKNKEESESIKVNKTVLDSFSTSQDEIKLKENKKEKGEKASKKSLDYILGVKGATIKITKLPKGFNETELFRFFKQFGNIKGVRVDRTTNGKFSTQAFIRFTDAEVAKIARDAMNGYIMFGKKLNVEVLNAWVPHQDSFCPRSLLPVASKMQMESLIDLKEREKEEKDIYNSKDKSILLVAQMLNHRIEKENELRQKLKDFNINYKFTGYLDIVKSALCPQDKPTTTKPETTKPETAKQQPTKQTAPKPAAKTETTKTETKPAVVAKTVAKKVVKSK